MMIIEVMGFLVVVSLLACAAAWVAEDGLRRLGRPTRWLWLAAMAAPTVLLVVPTLLPSGVPALVDGALGSTPVFELSPLVVGDGVAPSIPAWLASGFLISWAATSLGLLVWLVGTHRGLLTERGRWSPWTVAGRDVFLSDDRGPAVAGVLRPWIVIPRWALDLAERELDLVLRHEEEHVRAGDPALLAAALALVVLTPWNPIIWFQLRKLRTAVEVDCDRRVLLRTPDARVYGSSLLSVAAHSSGRSLGLAAFTERGLSLETRILAMTEKKTPFTPLRAALFVAVAALVGLQACSVENPVVFLEVDGPEAEAVGADGSGEVGELSERPVFTPFTVAPTIRNRAEVVAAMAAEYPPLLRDAGVGGTVEVYFFIDETGRVQDVRINNSSGHTALDAAALRVADMYEFQPALNRDQPRAVWVSFPITFQASAGEYRARETGGS